MSPELAVAFVAAVPGTIAAAASWVSARNGRRTQAIVNGNGKGNLTVMIEELLDWKDSHAQLHLSEAEQTAKFRRDVRKHIREHA